MPSGETSMAEPAHHLVGRALDGLAADDRAYRGDARGAPRRSASRIAGKRENRTERDERIRGREDRPRPMLRIASSAGAQWPRARALPRSSISLDHAAGASAHEIFLERHRARARAALTKVRTRSSLIGRTARLDAEALRDFRRDVAQAAAPARSRSVRIQMRREVAVAEVEPGLAVKAAERARAR